MNPHLVDRSLVSQRGVGFTLGRINMWYNVLRVTFATETASTDDENRPLGGNNLITRLVHDLHCNEMQVKMVFNSRFRHLPFVTITAPDFLSKMSTTLRLASRLP